MIQPVILFRLIFNAIGFIRRFYDENILNAELHLPPHLIRPGQVCVALYGGQWHRARIVDVYEDETIKVICSFVCLFRRIVLYEPAPIVLLSLFIFLFF